MIARRARSWAMLSGTWAALALACPTWAGESIDFFDGDFTTDWVYSQVTAGNGGSASMSVQGGGVPGSCVVAETHVNEDCGAIYAFAFKSSATYDPSAQGALASLNYSEDAKLIDGFGSGQATGPAIQQGGRLYVLPQFPTGTDTNWHHMARGGLTASAFIEVVGGGCPDYIDLGSHPDFSETGSTMTFGYFRANSQLDDFPEYSITAAIDNWFVSLGPIVYVALGDSFSAGEGVPAFFPDSHTSSNKCHRSMRAYGFKISFSGVQLDPVEFLACSGAETFNISGGIPPGNAPFEPAQLARIYPPPRSGTIVSDDTDMVTLTVGGNDLGFEEILTKCTLQLFPSCDSEAYHPHSGSIKSLRQIVGETLPLVESRAAGTYAAIKSQTENGAAVFVLGYPKLFGDGDCPATVDAAFSPSERQWLDSLADALNARLALAAAASGVHFVEVTTTFQGHGVCSPSPWVNAFNGPKYGWFHPTAMGQLMYGKRLTRHMKDWVTQQKPLFDTGLPANPSGFAAASAPDIPVDVPPSLGSLIVQPAGTPPCSMGDTYVPGQLVQVSGNRFGAGQVVTLRLLAGAYAASFATATADGTGYLDATVMLPSAAPTSVDAELTAEGLGADGELRQLAAGIRLSTSFASDADGDEVPDPCDNCPGLATFDTTDTDGDGLGDACDACPGDFENDLDGDGMCAGADPCPLDAANDGEADGVCESEDNCPSVANPNQADADGDDVGDACDAAPQDPGVYAAPAEVSDLAFANDVTLTWTSGGAAAGALTRHDLVRGSLADLPFEMFGPCIASAILEATATDIGVPAAGQGFWYLVRARNALGVGTYGYASSGSERNVFGFCP